MGLKEEYEKQIQGFYSQTVKRNFCKNYCFEDKIEDKIFNRRFNNPKVIFVFMKDNNLTEDFFKGLEKRIGNRANIIIIIYGPSNSGKSEVGMAIAMEMKRIFWLKKKREITIHMTFSSVEFSAISPRLKRGDILIRDESSKPHGKGSRTLQDNLDNVVDLVRLNQNSFIFICPTKLNSSQVTYFLETAGKNTKERDTRCILYDKTGDPQGRIFVSLHNDSEFRKNYMKRKSKNIKSMLISGGYLNAEPDLEKFKVDIDNLSKWCMNKEINKRNEILSEIITYNGSCTNQEEKITNKVFPDYVNNVITKVYTKIKQELKKIETEKKTEEENKKTEDEKRGKKKIERERRKLQDLFGNFTQKFHKTQIFNLIKQKEKWINPNRDIMIYKQGQNGLTAVDIVKIVYEDYGENLGIDAIYKIENKVETSLKHHKGEIFEIKFADHLIHLKKFDFVERDGRPRHPDVIAVKNDDYYVFSLKHYNVKDKSQAYFYFRDYRIEFSYAMDKKYMEKLNVHLFLVFLDERTGKTTIKEITLPEIQPYKIF